MAGSAGSVSSTRAELYLIRCPLIFSSDLAFSVAKSHSYLMAVCVFPTFTLHVINCFRKIFTELISASYLTSSFSKTYSQEVISSLWSASLKQAELNLFDNSWIFKSININRCLAYMLFKSIHNRWKLSFLRHKLACSLLKQPFNLYYKSNK